MGHHDLQAFTFEFLHPRVFFPQIGPVDIPINPDKGLELPDLIGQGKTAPEVPGMPDDVHRFQEFLNILGKDSVGIGYKANKHGYKYLKYTASAMVKAAVSVLSRDSPRWTGTKPQSIARATSSGEKSPSGPIRAT